MGLVIVFSCIFAAVVALFLAGCREKAEDVRRLWKEKRGIAVPVAFASTGLFISKSVRKLTHWSRETERLLLYDEDESLVKAANSYGSAYLVVALVTAVCLVLSVANCLTTAWISISRPEFGETKRVNTLVIDPSHEEELILSISGKDPAPEAMEAVFDEAMEAQKAVIMGENESFSAVSSRLQFEPENDWGILLSYQSSDTEIVSNYGTVWAENVSESGAGCDICVTLTYKGHSKSYTIPVTVVPKTKEKTWAEKVQDAVSEADQADLSGETVVLPGEVDGISVKFAKTKQSPVMIFGLGLLLVIGIVAMKREQEKEALKKREEELKMAYAPLLSKFCAFLDAGMSIRSVWSKISKDYRAKSAGERRKKVYLYEEMCVAMNEIESGRTEAAAYSDFARRTGLHCYVKFANLLSESLRQGVSGLRNALNEEVEDALEERKNMALKKGEEAGTKQLFPMLLMLGIVVVVLVMPAFMAF